jgi:hypothetical protein
MIRETLVCGAFLLTVVHCAHASEPAPATQVIIPMPKFRPSEIAARYLAQAGHPQAANVLSHIVVKRHMIGVAWHL